jgi:hypothetical protein
MKAKGYQMPDEAARGLDRPDAAINLTIIYEDPLTQEWAGQVYDQVTEFIDREQVANNSWRVCDLAASQVLPDAVCAAAQADVIILSIHDGDELALNLQAWVEAWLPRRDLPVGALITLICVAEDSKASSLRARKQLEAVARRARMDLLLEERWLQPLSPQIADRDRDSRPANIKLRSLDTTVGRDSGACDPGGNARTDDSTHGITPSHRNCL